MNGNGLSLLNLLLAIILLAIPAFFINDCDSPRNSDNNRHWEPEVEQNIEQIFKSIIELYEKDCSFPANQGATPAESCCGEFNSYTRNSVITECVAQPDNWSSPTWQALGFVPEAPHQFVYSFSTGLTHEFCTRRIDGKCESPPTLYFEVTAHGDFDCDGVRSVFQRRGFVDPNKRCKISDENRFYEQFRGE